jgi:hypothetical protein
MSEEPWGSRQCHDKEAKKLLGTMQIYVLFREIEAAPGLCGDLFCGVDASITIEDCPIGADGNGKAVRAINIALIPANQ